MAKDFDLSDFSTEQFDEAVQAFKQQYQPLPDTIGPWSFLGSQTAIDYFAQWTLNYCIQKWGSAYNESHPGELTK